MNRKHIFYFALSIAALITLIACSDDKEAATAARETVDNLDVLTVQPTTVPDFVDSTGTVAAAESAQLSTQVLASVVAVNVHEGDRVRRGQVLVVLDDAQFRASTDRANAAVVAAEKETAAATANYTLTDATLKRYQNLFDKKSVSPQEFDEVKARYSASQAQLEAAHAGQAQARAALAEAKTMQGYTRLVAPFDGVITTKRVDIGTMAAPGMPLLTVENTSRYRLEASVNEADISVVHIGMAAPVTIEAAAATPVDVKVSQIIPAADPASRAFIVKFDLPDLPNLRSGLFGRVSIPKGSRQALLVPKSAIIDRGQLQAVYLVGSDRVINFHYVTLGHASDTNLEVLSGLEPGDRIVADPRQRDLNGKMVGARQ